VEQEYKQQILDFIHNMSLTIDRYRTKYHIDTSLFINQNIKEEEFKSTTSRKRVSTITNSSNKKPLVIPNVLHEIERCTKSQLFEFLQLITIESFLRSE
jgi:hypothetical protein